MCGEHEHHIGLYIHPPQSIVGSLLVHVCMVYDLSCLWLAGPYGSAVNSPDQRRSTTASAGPKSPPPTKAHTRINTLNEPAVTYDPTEAATVQAMPGPHPQGADLLG